MSRNSAKKKPKESAKGNSTEPEEEKPKIKDPIEEELAKIVRADIPIIQLVKTDVQPQKYIIFKVEITALGRWISDDGFAVSESLRSMMSIPDRFAEVNGEHEDEIRKKRNEIALMGHRERYDFEKSIQSRIEKFDKALSNLVRSSDDPGLKVNKWNWADVNYRNKLLEDISSYRTAVMSAGHNIELLIAADEDGYSFWRQLEARNDG